MLAAQRCLALKRLCEDLVDDATTTSRRTALRETVRTCHCAWPRSVLQPQFVTAACHVGDLHHGAPAARPSVCRTQRLHHHRRGCPARGPRGTRTARVTAGRRRPAPGVLLVGEQPSTAGQPTSLGPDSLAHFIPREDADVVLCNSRRRGCLRLSARTIWWRCPTGGGLIGKLGHTSATVGGKNPMPGERVTGEPSGEGSAASGGCRNLYPASGGDMVGSIVCTASSLVAS